MVITIISVIVSQSHSIVHSIFQDFQLVHVCIQCVNCIAQLLSDKIIMTRLLEREDSFFGLNQSRSADIQVWV